MSPKRATISLALLSLTLTLTLSSAAAHNGCPGNSVADVLKHYDLPAGLFPNTVQHFSCDPVRSSNKDALNLSIRLQGVCKVTRELLMIKNVLECEPEISAIISRGQLTNVKGVTVMLSFVNLPVGELMTISEVKVTPDLFWGKILQFFSAEGINSPAFPIFLIPDEPPTCEGHSSARLVAAAKNNQDVPYSVYKYGRLLPPVIA